MVLFFVALNIGFIGVIYKCFSETLTFVVVVVIVVNVGVVVLFVVTDHIIYLVEVHKF